MKTNYLIYLIVFFVFESTRGYCTKYTVSATNTDYVFASDSVVANVGDTIVFALGSIHSALEVSQSTWQTNGVTANGGFHVPFGGGILPLTLSMVGTRYYVCENHYFMGMKGQIVVSNPNAIRTVNKTNPDLELLPNPVSGGAVIKSNLPEGKFNQLKIYDMAGHLVLKKDNITDHQYLDLSSLAHGTYFVAIKYDDVILEKKLIVSK